MKPYAIIAFCWAALAGLVPAFGADADPLAAGAALEADAMAAVSGARPGADDPPDGAPTPADLTLPSTPAAADASVQVVGSGNAVSSAVLVQTLPGPAVQPAAVAAGSSGL